MYRYDMNLQISKQCSKMTVPSNTMCCFQKMETANLVDQVRLSCDRPKYALKRNRIWNSCQHRPIISRHHPTTSISSPLCEPRSESTCSYAGPSSSTTLEEVGPGFATAQTQPSMTSSTITSQHCHFMEHQSGPWQRPTLTGNCENTWFLQSNKFCKNPSNSFRYPACIQFFRQEMNLALA